MEGKRAQLPELQLNSFKTRASVSHFMCAKKKADIESQSGSELIKFRKSLDWLSEQMKERLILKNWEICKCFKAARQKGKITELSCHNSTACTVR